ncbi:platelet glycoprotein V-like [Bombina bombina]|uniref:platelet glycoprotein V-like n=1 Tax=Bombina bombina TaxID=8345 RepID=UPI00235AB1E7|nr:platelet glycoprotein V-like [Bombina bombina]
MIVTLLLILSVFLPADSSCPTKCSCKVKDAIHCLGNSITDIASLYIPSNYTYIFIKDTLATELTEKSLGQMPVALRLILESNQISSITSGAFNGLPLLKSIKLTDNKLETLPPGVFNSLSNLQQLFIDKNSLVRLDSNVFDHLENLEQLILKRNNLMELPDGILKNLKNLATLNLSNNKLSVLPRNVFSNLTKLESLVLYENKLVEISSWMFADLRNLLELLLYSNNIQSVAFDAFHNLPKLHTLKLAKNKLKTLPDGLFFNLPYMTSLSLYANPLVNLPNVLFCKMDKLMSFWLYDTELTIIPNMVFSNFSNLQLLVLTRNKKLQSLPKDAFSGLGNILELALHSNNLSTLDKDVFQNLHKINIISLYNNNLNSLPGSIFHNLTNLEYVYLNNSNLQTLPGNFFKPLPILKMVRLDGNPWTCDCAFVDFNAWLQQNKDRVQYVSSLLCNAPESLKNTSVLKIVDPLCLKTTDEYTTPNLATSSYTSAHQYSQPISTTPIEAVSPTVIMELLNSSAHRSTFLTTKEWKDYTGTFATKTVSTEQFYIIHDKETYNFKLRCKLIFILYMSVVVIHIFITMMTCFVLFKIRKLFRYFDEFIEPVVLLRILIPLQLKQNCPHL